MSCKCKNYTRTNLLSRPPPSIFSSNILIAILSLNLYFGLYSSVSGRDMNPRPKSSSSRPLPIFCYPYLVLPTVPPPPLSFHPSSRYGSHSFIVP